MAFCVKCGAKLDDGALFCTNCGSKVEEEVTAAKEEAKEEVKEVVEETTAKAEEVVKEVKEEVKEEAPKAAPQPTPQPAPQQQSSSSNTASTQTSVDVDGLKKKIASLPKFVWIIAVAAIVVIIALVIFVNSLKHTINFNDYLEVEFTGYDTIGKCNAEWSADFWDEFYDKAAKIPSSSNYEAMMKKMQFEVEPAEGLSNGDKVTIKWKVDKKYFKKKYGLNVKCDDMKIKVEDLEEVDTFNPFDGIEITYSGIDGEGNAAFTVTSDDPIYSDLDFYIDPSYDLANGGKITVELQMRGAYGEDEIVDKCADKYGEVPSAFEQTYTVEGLGHYVTKCDELNDKNLAPLFRTAEDALTEETTDYGGWGADGTATMSNKKYIGSYVLTEKNHGDNMVYLVYEVTADMEDEGQTDSVTYYTYVMFHDVTINDDGELSCDTSYHSRPSTFRYESTIKDGYWTNSYSFYGYETITQMNDDIVTGNLSRYDSDTNVSQSQGGDTATEEDIPEEDTED